MIGVVLGFLAGMIACCFIPEKAQGWVRAAWAVVWGRVSKRAPAPQSATVATLAAAKAATRPASEITLAGVLGGAGNLLTFLWRWKLALIALAILIIGWSFIAPAYRFARCPFGGWGPLWCAQSNEDLRERAANAEAEVETQKTINKRDAGIADVSREVALLRQEIENLSERGRDEIAAATPENEAPLDAELVSAWRNAIDRLRIYPSGDAASANSSEPGA